MIWQTAIVLALVALVGVAGFAAGVWWAGHDDAELDRWDADHPND